MVKSTKDQYEVSTKSPASRTRARGVTKKSSPKKTAAKSTKESTKSSKPTAVKKLAKGKLATAKGSKKAIAKKRPAKIRIRAVVTRTTKYSKTIAFEILDLMELKGLSLREALASKPEYPTRRTFYRWRQKVPELEAEYLLVCEVRDDNDFDEMEDIARRSSNETWARDRLLIDTRKWALAKRQPTRYGTKKVEADVKHSGDITISMTNYDEDEDGKDSDSV